MMNDEFFPRELEKWERELLLWILPDDREGYRPYRQVVERWNVVARGRRGEGNYILAPLDERPDNESPLPQVFAYGIVITHRQELSVTVRERLGNQVECEIAVVGRGSPEEPKEELRRWTFSTWLPDRTCPCCADRVREIEMRTKGGHRLVLAICARDHRLWVYDHQNGVNHPVPVTNFYNELMMYRNIRTPEIAFDQRKLFRDLSSFSDADLSHAFRSYNNIRMKVQLETDIVIAERSTKSWLNRIATLVQKRRV